MVAGVRWAVMAAPIGPLALAVDDAGVCSVRFDGVPGGPLAGDLGGPLAGDPLLSAAADQLGAYFAGELTGFDLPLSVHGGSDFERRVWAELARIPYGETRSYGQIAAALGDPGAARAVGIANNRNRLPILIPCHRVIGADGKLVGFGGGLARKRHLLELEARVRVEREFAGQ